MPVTNLGNTSSVERVRPGVVKKSPHSFQSEKLQKSVETSFAVERQILQRLGNHPRIVRYLGQCPDDPRALLLGEATHSDLQTYLDKHPEPPPPNLALRCQCKILVGWDDSEGADAADHGDATASLSLRLADFGGSVCHALHLDGAGFASTPFWHPALGYKESVALDLFGLGSLMYVLFMVLWPYKDTPGRPETREAREAYEARVDPLLLAEKYPEDVDSLPVGAVIRRCWTRGDATADEVVQDLEGVCIREGGCGEDG